jgi:mRNA interferase MazF
MWTPVKQEINNLDLRPKGCREREIWLCNIGENIGFEEDGKGGEFTRPILVLKVFNRNFCHVVPLLTTKRRGVFYYPFDGKTGVLSVALLSQSRPIDTLRLVRKVGNIGKKDFEIMKYKMKELLF